MATARAIHRQSLGRQEKQDAEAMASTGFFSALLAGALFMGLGLLFLEPLVKLLGSTDTIAPHAKSYAFYILLAAPFMVSSFVLNNLLRFQGSAFYSMIGMCSGAVANIALDPLFIFGLDMGVGGRGPGHGPFPDDQLRPAADRLHQRRQHPHPPEKL